MTAEESRPADDLPDSGAGYRMLHEPDGDRLLRERAAEPPAGHYRKPSSRWGDAVLAVFVLFIDVVALAVTALWLFVSRLQLGAADSGGRKADAGGPAPAAPPAEPSMDWGPMIGFGITALMIALTAYAFARGGLLVTSWAQTLVAITVGAILLLGLAHEHPHTRPDPGPTYGPGSGAHWNPACRDGDTQECIDGSKK
ncbi:DUF6234 family protein [Streptomyces sp. T-3]|nr:DUF6234 family protein [Streptomyces sp. T-3]